jgi:hypothetical protein
LLSDGLGCGRLVNPSLQQEVIMNRDNWYVFVIGGLIIVGVVIALAYHPSGRGTGQKSSQLPPPAMNDSSAGSSTGQSGKALPSQTPAKGSATAPAQAPAQ